MNSVADNVVIMVFAIIIMVFQITGEPESQRGLSLGNVRKVPKFRKACMVGWFIGKLSIVVPRV